MRDEKLRILVEGALMVAVAFALSFVKVFHLPQGGSVTLGSMIPILLFSARRGTGAGIMAGTVYGILQFIVEPYFVHPAQLILDYPLAFGLLGLAGLFGEDILKGTLLGVFGRFVSHFISGVIFFAEYAEGNVYAYSAAYQASYLVPEFIISVLVLRVGLYNLVKKSNI
ncbi:MAG TPA: energy-coupled thiamine transporter ThiT [Firmicutes bacterium]|nr:energy-coupled thiamine transporter ThiT [Candidatus Fermentithermobacillaceae bacterium]